MEQRIYLFSDRHDICIPFDSIQQYYLSMIHTYDDSWISICTCHGIHKHFRYPHNNEYVQGFMINNMYKCSLVLCASYDI